MSLLQEFLAESQRAKANSHRSKIDIFIETLPPRDRAEFDEWLKNPFDKSAMYRALKERGLDVALPTFVAWAPSCH